MKNGFTKRYQMVNNFDFVDRTNYFDSKEEKERKDLLRKARYIVVIDGKVNAGGDCYGLEGKAIEGAIIYRLANAYGEVENILNFREGYPLYGINYDPCEEYREEYLKKYGGKVEDLEQ